MWTVKRCIHIKRFYNHKTTLGPTGKATCYLIRYEYFHHLAIITSLPKNITWLRALYMKHNTTYNAGKWSGAELLFPKTQRDRRLITEALHSFPYTHREIQLFLTSQCAIGVCHWIQTCFSCSNLTEDDRALLFPSVLRETQYFLPSKHTNSSVLNNNVFTSITAIHCRGHPVVPTYSWRNIILTSIRNVRKGVSKAA